MKRYFKFISIRNILCFWIAVLVFSFSILVLFDSKSNSKDVLTKNLQSSINKEFNDIKLNGDTFKYCKNNLVSWTNNDVPLPQIYSSNLNNNFIKLPNGYYLLLQDKKNDTITLYVLLLKKEYSINNSYLKNVFNTKFDLKDKDNINITPQKTNYPIALRGKVICYLDFSSYSSQSNSLLSYILSILYFLIIYLVTKLLSKIIIRKIKLAYWIRCIFLFIIYIILYLLLHFIEVSSLIFNVYFFTPFSGTNDIVSSYGELIVFQLLILAFISSIKFYLKKDNSKLLLGLILIPATWLYLYFIQFILNNSSTTILLADIINFDNSVFVLLLQLMLGSFTLYVFATKVLLKPNDKTKRLALTYILLFFTSVLSVVFLINQVSILAIVFIVFTLYIIYISIYNQKILKKKLSPILYFIIILISFSIINGVLIYTYNFQTQKLFVEEAINQLSNNKDKRAENILLETEKKIINDKLFISNLKNKTNEEINKYIINNYLLGLYKTYSVEIINCFSDESLYIPPLNKSLNSQDYFKTRILNAKKLVNSQSIYHDNKQLTEKSYFGYFEIQQGGRTKILFIDCIEKKASNEMGYPDLLINEQARLKSQKTELDYYGVYQDNNLVLQEGNYEYSHTCSFQPNLWYKSNGFIHYVIKNKTNNTVWITSIKEQTLSDKLSIPSYLFLFSSIALIIILVILRPKKLLSIKGVTISNSLQITMVLIFLISFIVFGSMSIKYFNRLNENTNKDIQFEKTQSIYYELKDYFEEPKHGYEETYYQLVKLSNTFLTDINIYDTNGILLNTSRPTIFSQGIISKCINSYALKQLKTSTTPLICEDERIGNRDYSATYMVITNNNGNDIGYLHIPYIIKQKNLEDKILEFVSAFINIYILWITLALILSILLSNFITRPLRQLQDRLKRVKLDERNEKILWTRKDELGDLISTYNSMVDKLDESAKLLLKKEREGAWKEMAKQVAHDIKNPLTPMKLSIQQLQRLQSTDIVKFHERFQELTPALIEQINVLAEIASEFSDYAKDKPAINETTNIGECLKSAVEVFENQDNIKIIYNNPYDNNLIVFGDKQQYIRIFNNLIKNSIQSLYHKEDGLIEIKLEQEENEYHISIRDNGCGMSEENKEKVFSSQFTTKVEGSGLGLSIVKSIIEIIGGRINFISEENKGTIFNVYLPIWKQ